MRLKKREDVDLGDIIMAPPIPAEHKMMGKYA
jgi:hypothetical protein